MPFLFNPLSGTFDFYRSTSNEDIDDRVATLLLDSADDYLTWTYDDLAGSLTPTIKNYISEIIFDQSEANPNNINVFSDYDTMIDHINNDLSGARVRITLRRNETLPVRTNQNWNGITWSGNGNPASLGGLVLTIPDGFTVSTWTNALIDGGLHFKSVSTSPMMTISSSVFLFSMIFANVISSTQCEIFRLTSSGGYFVLGVGGGGIVKNDGYEVVNLYSNFPILVSSVGGPNAKIEANTIRGGTGFFFNQLTDIASSNTTVTNTQANYSSTQSNALLGVPENIDWNAKTINTDTTTGLKIGGSTTQKLGFFGVTPVVQQTEITDELTTVTHTAPGTPDYAIAAPVDSSGGAAFGFSTADEFNTIMSVIANLQTRSKELEDRLKNLGLIADAD